MKNNFKYDKLTPMLKHYVDVKNDFKDAILLYRVGDFYEAFFDDAIITSKALSLTLTGKECGHEKKAPMCGVPHHVIDNYAFKLVKQGYKVALCDQVEDPKEAKGLVKRAITRVITPGTITDMESLDNRKNNYLLSIFQNDYGLSISYCDISTGKLVSFEIKGLSSSIGKKAIDQIEKINPSEILINSDFNDQNLRRYFLDEEIFVNYIQNPKDYMNRASLIRDHLGDDNLKKIENMRLSILSLANLLDYIYKYHKDNLVHINNIDILEINDYMELEASTRKNLELSKNLNNNTKENSLLSIIDKADTVMGSRMISEYLERPLIDKRKIERRLDIVEVLFNDRILASNISNLLSDVYDLERLIAKISYKRANGRDFISLKNSIANIPKLKDILRSYSDTNISNIGENIPDVSDIFDLIDKAIVEDPPIAISEGGIIKDSYNDELDKLKESSSSAQSALIEYENKEREKTGIKNYKIVFNKNNGYSIEITKSNLDKVPDSYVRKQTLKNQERYTTEKLEEISSLILGGKDRINDLEYKIFQEIREKVLKNTIKLQALAKILATVDTLNTFAKISLENSYVRPVIREDNIIKIKDGRHPVIERKLKENEFIPNDTDIGEENNLIQIITGPNMAGKSTYMRQMAIIIILAQMGCFVPASLAEISICDQVFTRIGASDNISKGESTFMLEMNEVSSILKNSTEHSFVILDEVGRGTSSDDGLSIAMAIVEYLSKRKKVKTVFATHFHELTILEKELDNVKNLKIEILEENNNLVFLRKISEGKSDRSYGIEVAKLSGLPNEIIDNAKIIMDKLSTDDFYDLDKKKEISTSLEEISDQKLEEVKIEASNIDINNLTPMEAINSLSNLLNKIGEL
ncbi:DNA mismatch repair protein mutS [Anaerococcus prevotii]|uniref:DNA mismatch repair protein MutS n=1 Tax=Anaerococcus prevotii (strain ATCC 9321 / DSM 20548 / JCM 6508 / NCTC 11806 / PC1) TaxID=525919 RepID=C7RHL5_ANAPD|nr:DNA mismatch repair protein MutS [Anaerococcus prevotii]ACV28976.1 DNA mismatch repair protein MutS [Anaerococcus prevotii DSM 20548]SUU94649.1 DNA mismatch repair protein mutS [Anaerococcus prevotii]